MCVSPVRAATARTVIGEAGGLGMRFPGLATHYAAQRASAASASARSSLIR